MRNIDRTQIKNIGELIPGTIAIYRANGDSLETLYTSKELPSILGMDEAEYSSLSASDAIDVVIPEDREKVVAALHACVEGKLQNPDIFYRVYNRKMDVDWVHLRAKKIGMMEDRPVFMCSFTNSSVETDIYQGIINHTDSMIYVSDRDSYQVLYANKASRIASGNQDEVLYGKKCYEYILNRTSPCEDCLMKKAKENQSVNIVRFNAQKQIWEHVYGEFVDWCGHRGFVQHIEDVTDQENTRREIESAEKRVEMAAQAAQLNTWQFNIEERCITYGQGDFEKYGLPKVIHNVPESLLPKVAEEDRRKLITLYQRLVAGETRITEDFCMRTPLNGIIGLTYLTEEMPLPETAQKNLHKIDTSSKFLLGLINDILDMAKAESGKVALKLEPYTISEFNEYLDAVIRPLCRERNLNFVLDESGIEDRIPLADKLRINQVLFNLLSNAVKYTPEGGTITYTIQSVQLPDQRVQITHTISDTGIGMSKEFLTKLFDPFTQEERTEGVKVQGTGLGLAIVKRMVDLMGGTIKVESTLDKGSTFILTLEFDTVEPGAETNDAQKMNEDPSLALAGKHGIQKE